MTPPTSIATFLLLTALASWSGATEATDNALHKGNNPLKEAMGKPIHANRVFQHGYHCWDPSLIKRGDTYHLFYSRWNMSCVPRETSQSAPTEGASIIIWPVKNWKPKTTRQ